MPDGYEHELRPLKRCSGASETVRERLYDLQLLTFLSFRAARTASASE